MKNKILSLTLVIIAATSLVGCQTNTTSDNNVTPTSSSTAEADITVNMSNFEYDPAEIRVTAGQTITIKLISSGMQHDFVIDELDVNSGTIAPGDESIITVTVPADAAGKTYTYYCSVSNHRALGMIGKLIVE